MFPMNFCESRNISSSFDLALVILKWEMEHYWTLYNVNWDNVHRFRSTKDFFQLKMGLKIRSV